MAKKEILVPTEAELQLTFDSHDTTTRGCLFVWQPPKKGKTQPKKEVYVRAKVDNITDISAGFTRVFMTRLEHVSAKGNKTLLCDDTMALNWAASGGAEREFYADFEHYVDLFTFKECAKSFELMSLRKPTYLKEDLKKTGIYRLHLLLAGEYCASQRAILEFKWPMKAAKGGDWSKNFSFSLTK